MKIIFFCMVKYFSFHNSSFALRFQCKWQGHSLTHPLLIPVLITFGLQIFGLQFLCLILPLLIVAPCSLMPLYKMWTFLVFVVVVVAHLCTSVLVAGPTISSIIGAWVNVGL